MEEIAVLLAMRGLPEETLLRHFQTTREVTVARRCADYEEVVAAALAGVGDAAIMDAGRGVERSLILRLRSAGVAPIVVAPLPQHAALSKMGADPIDSEAPDLAAAVMAALQAVEPVDEDPIPELPTDPGEAHPTLARKVIAVMSPWGSPGRTTLAVNLAAEYARRGSHPLVVDADVWGASVRQHLGLDPDGAGIAAAMRAVERGTFDLPGLRRLAEAHASGVHVLGGLNKAERWREVSGGALESLWEVVRLWPGEVVIDAPVQLPAGEVGVIGGFGPAPNDMWEAVWEHASDLCLIGSADTVGIDRFVNFYLNLAASPARTHAVINRVRPSAAGPRAKESILELLARFAQIDHPILLSEDPQVDRALLDARPLPTSAPRAPARVGIEALSNRILPQRERGSQRKRGKARRRMEHT